MIVCRKPCTIFDVDAIALSILLVIALAAWFVVAKPALANATEYRELTAKIGVANAAVASTSDKLSAVQTQCERLRAGVECQAEAAPKSDALTFFLNRITNLALECGVTITQVVPRPVRRNDGYLSNDILFTAKGGSLDFARLLDRLACENPYFTLEEYALKRLSGPGATACEITWTLRLYMLEDKPTMRKEGGP